MPNKLAWYIARLRAMPAGEIRYRVGQSIRQQLRRISAGRGASRLVVTPDNELLLAGNARVRTMPVRFFDICLEYPDCAPIDWARDYKHGFSAPKVFYGKLNYRDEKQVGDIKYTWELNRHQFLAGWALEYQRTRDERVACDVVDVIGSWVKENPKYIGVNWMSSLELALRILSWGIALDLCRNSAAVQDARSWIAASVGEQAEYIRQTLSRFSSGNNHLMGELTGLLAAAVFFPEIQYSNELAQYAREAICEQAMAQNAPDGVNREQAIYYHHYTLEYLLTAMALLERRHDAMPASVRELVKRMLSFVDAMVDGRGVPLETGDRDDGCVTGLNAGSGIGVYESLLWSGWRVFREERLLQHAVQIAQARGAEPGIDPRTAYWHGSEDVPAGIGVPAGWRWVFPQGGYYISRQDGLGVMFKAGPFTYPSIGAHAHCDQLSVCCVVSRSDVDHGAEAEVLADSGTYCYHTHDVWRRYFRGTSAHNTVRVDGLDQAEYGGPFLWTTHADAELRVEHQSKTGFAVCGKHCGYMRLKDPVSHMRRVQCETEAGGECVLHVLDHLESDEEHVYELFWNFGPKVSLLENAEKAPEGQGSVRRWEILVSGVYVMTLSIRSELPFEAEVRRGEGGRDGVEGVEAVPARGKAGVAAQSVCVDDIGGWYSRRFLEKVPVPQLCIRVKAADWNVDSVFEMGLGG